MPEKSVVFLPKDRFYPVSDCGIFILKEKKDKNSAMTYLCS
jgi:hypothetical protein